VTAWEGNRGRGLRNHEHADRWQSVCVRAMAQGPGACRDYSWDADPIAQVRAVQPPDQVEKNSDGRASFVEKGRAQGKLKRASQVHAQMACLWPQTRAPELGRAFQSSRLGVSGYVGAWQGQGTWVDRLACRACCAAPARGVQPHLWRQNRGMV